jgi:hypothetical protein
VPESWVPTLAAAAKRFSGRIYTVARDRKTGLVALNVDWRDRQEAAQWNRQLVATINEEMRRRAMADADQYIAYLESELGTTQLLETRLAISRLLDAQIKQRMMAKVTREYAFRTVDPGMVPDADDVLRPRKLELIALGPVVGLTLGVGYVLLAWALGGAPATTQQSGTSRVTTELAPTTQFRPMVTPITQALCPSQVPSPIETSGICRMGCCLIGRATSSNPCRLSEI